MLTHSILTTDLEFSSAMVVICKSAQKRRKKVDDHGNDAFSATQRVTINPRVGDALFVSCEHSRCLDVTHTHTHTHTQSLEHTRTDTQTVRRRRKERMKKRKRTTKKREEARIETEGRMRWRRSLDMICVYVHRP